MDSRGRGLLMLLPSEAKMAEKLKAAKVPLEEIEINPAKQVNIEGTLQSIVAADTELKYLAQKVRCESDVGERRELVGERRERDQREREREREDLPRH